MSNPSTEELQQLSYKLTIPSAITLILSIFGFTTFGFVISLIIHIIVLGIFFLLSKEFKSAFLRLVLTGLVMCLVGEILVFFNLEHIRYENEYWAFVITHFIRNIALGGAFAWNALKSHIFNQLWVKLVPLILGIALFFVLQIFVFSQEESYTIFFLVYNATLSFMVLSSALRYNHTSDRSFVIMIVAMLSFLLSDIFYFWEYMPEQANSIAAALRCPFLQLGSCLMVAGTVDHVIHFKQTVKQRIYLPMTEKESTILKTKTPVSITKSIFNIGKKKAGEPLI